MKRTSRMPRGWAFAGRTRPDARPPTAGRREARSRSEAGDTLVEVLLALVVLAICGVALLGAFATAITASASHRVLANLNTALTSYAETATRQIQEGLYVTCADSSTYTQTVALPSSPLLLSYTNTAGSYWVTIDSVSYADGSGSFSLSCTQSLSPPQLIAVTVTSPDRVTKGSISFVVIQHSNTQPIITTAALPYATSGVSYPAQQLIVAGGTSPYTWKVTAGTLPTGLTLSAAGKISGTPTVPDYFTFTVVATDALGAASAGQSLSINVASGTPIITTTALADGTIGVPYSAPLVATGGTGTYTWQITAGTLPDGLAVSADGVISGTPTAVGAFTFTVVATDTNGVASAGQSLTLTVNSGPPTITTTSLPDGKKKNSYSSALVATGGTGTYTWQITAGTLPDGLTLSTTGVISGTPTANGSFTFTVITTDANEVASAGQSLTLTVK